MTTTAPPAAALEVEPLTIAGRTFRSRLILGTGKYKDGAGRIPRKLYASASSPTDGLIE